MLIRKILLMFVLNPFTEIRERLVFVNYLSASKPPISLQVRILETVMN